MTTRAGGPGRPDQQSDFSLHPLYPISRNAVLIHEWL